jgi:hypothetical protein
VRPDPWLRVGLGLWSLAWEASLVIGLRTLKLAAGGPAAQAEADRAISEKVEAAAALQAAALTGALGSAPAAATTRAVAHYRRKVRANRRRLLKS